MNTVSLNSVSHAAEQADGRKPADGVLLFCVIALMVFGCLAVYSSVAYFAENKGDTAAGFLFKHGYKLVLAFIAMFVAAKINYYYVAAFSKAVLILSWLLLLWVNFYGGDVHGARRSLTVAGFAFQPSSVAMLALLMYLCRMMAEKRSYIEDFWRSFVPALTWIGVTALLVGLQDFSSAALILGLSFMMMFVGRMSLKHLGLLLLLGGVLGGILVSQTLERQSRLTNYVGHVLTIQSQVLVGSDAGYQAQQAHIAIAQGGLLGVGAGKSTQRNFLPAPYNDYIYAIIAEEYGLIGALILLFIYVVILLRGIIFVANRARDELGTYMAMACTLAIVVYGFVNAAVATGLFPVTGLPMPFISYGGTSMLTAGFMMGVLMNISKHPQEEPEDA
ncbi:cell division protein FtsW [Cyclonatronum proteinivorum]|uniref:Probable peptidoglycan glycosyltransferase FtsW n=1 Tax=Cyclonatronum proteinivorum TaxID=1457365 RepID=A0A345UIP4_9BACT|nr:FtsW/RodA/SpoVE family cell cycle protein [Cyclonatronum proteinivorum]AXJ00346.1 cell division protein FtsW [Cyclonatronum proteinivorum]